MHYLLHQFQLPVPVLLLHAATTTATASAATRNIAILYNLIVVPILAFALLRSFRFEFTAKPEARASRCGSNVGYLARCMRATSTMKATDLLAGFNPNSN